MHAFVSYYGMFLLEAITIVVAILVVLLGAAGILAKGKGGADKGLKVISLNKQYAKLQHQLAQKVLDKKAFKALLKAHKQSTKNKSEPGKRFYLIDFKGDIQAKAAEALRKQVTAVLTLATPKDEVVVRVESGGGVVHGYGFAASQLARIKDANIPLTVCVDKVAASGGYMMAAVAHKIIAAPFAIVGSIGVLAQMPNFHRWLDKHGIDFEQHTAGDFKRTVTMFGKNTKQDREKLQEELEATHELFKRFITTYRPQVDLKKVATGEHWYGQQALDMKLVDVLQTSDDYLYQAYVSEHSIYQLKIPTKRGLLNKLMQNASVLFK
jgi:serine protease SohB